MRDRMERFVLLPFSVGCISESSIAVTATHQPRRSSSSPKPAHTNTNANSSPIKRNREEDEESTLSTESMKNSFRDISTGFHRLFKSFKSFSQLFVYKDDEEMEEDIEIGFPTDVKHVTHIGLDGSATNNTMIKGWDNLIPPDNHHYHHQLLTDSVSLGQFHELNSMAVADKPVAT